MARKRMIDPGIWQSEQLARLTRDQRLLFVGIFSNADDEGRLKGSPKYLKMAIFPGDEDITSSQVEAWRDAIANATDGNGKAPIQVYSVCGVEYIDLPSWKTYQKIDKPSPSHLPSFEEHSSNDSRTLVEYSATVPARARAEEKESKGNRGREIEEEIRVADADAPPIKKNSRKFKPVAGTLPISEAFAAAGLRDPITSKSQERYGLLLVTDKNLTPEQLANCYQDIKAGMWGDGWTRDNCCFKTLYERDRILNWLDWIEAGRPVLASKRGANGAGDYSQKTHL